ncbi:hypothetical protein A5664_27465 [Mycolicibacterium fortuitum]|nr:hypothetical protein A5664_27465 [Mycolicibacterium fortuitum]
MVGRGGNCCARVHIVIPVLLDAQRFEGVTGDVPRWISLFFIWTCVLIVGRLEVSVRSPDGDGRA